jgi:hypothetical protein
MNKGTKMADHKDRDNLQDSKSHSSDDSQIEEDFEERQRMADQSSERELEEDLKYTSVSPRLSGGDLDADWKDANSTGEETVGGTTPTPDQDMVDELGEAVGLTYKGDEELGGGEKLAERDRQRWELNPESAQEDDQST